VEGEKRKIKFMYKTSNLRRGMKVGREVGKWRREEGFLKSVSLQQTDSLAGERERVPSKKENGN